MTYVAVVGPSTDASAADLTAAEEVGRRLAERGAIVLTGGGAGVMAAAARGCTAAGGTAVGLLPGSDRAEANPHQTVVLPTGLGELRNALIVRSADAVIAVGGSWGTLSEIALAVRTLVPIVTLGGWRISDASGNLLPLARVDTAAAAVDAVFEALAAR